MAVDTLWRRISQESVRDRPPSALRTLVPHFLEEGYEAEASRGVLVGVEDTGALIGELLKRGAGEGPGATAARQFSDLPPDWDDHWMIGTFDPDAVGRIADLFAQAPLDGWAAQHATALSDAAAGMGYSGGQLAWLLETLPADAQEVAALFVAAAAQKEIVIFRVVV